ncbi:DnaJ domain-containing protein [Bradyrhizobium septentrionale]|uniref:DnaJ domain-containing protein n=1 Tax=Bradyrhizobium septentrionale TaxID=1404411 RepID=A0ABZ2NZN9_9BRAD
MRDADPEVLKAAYLALVKKYHPDRTGNDPTRTKRFLEIRAAWELLTDQQGRAFYDQQSAAEAAATKSQSSNSDLNRNEPRQTAGSFTKSKPSIFERLQMELQPP